MPDYRVTFVIDVPADNARQAVICALQSLALDGNRVFRAREEHRTAEAVSLDPASIIAAI